MGLDIQVQGPGYSGTLGLDTQVQAPGCSDLKVSYTSMRDYSDKEQGILGDLRRGCEIAFSWNVTRYVM